MLIMVTTAAAATNGWWWLCPSTTAASASLEIQLMLAFVFVATGGHSLSFYAFSTCVSAYQEGTTLHPLIRSSVIESNSDLTMVTVTTAARKTVTGRAAAAVESQKECIKPFFVHVVEMPTKRPRIGLSRFSPTSSERLRQSLMLLCFSIHFIQFIVKLRN